MTEFDKYLFHEGKHYECYKFMGSHIKVENRKRGVRFTTWAKNAEEIYVVGDFNNWSIDKEYKLVKDSDNGLWTIFVTNAKKGDRYKFAIRSLNQDNFVLKADPYARFSQVRPDTASEITSASKFKWEDKEWIKLRKDNTLHNNPINIYEVHLGSWKRKNGEFLTYKELKDELVSYVKAMNYTHVEIMPIHEHPLDESWGYQATGFYSVTSRFGTPDDFRELINEFHKNNIGVILDFVPGHFCRDEHGLYKFDGTASYEYDEQWKADNKGWGTSNFDLGRPEVRSFLISNAVYFMKEFHIDGIRVDAVSNIIYLNYGRESDEWIPNEHGTNLNLHGIDFLQELCSVLESKFKGVILAAEESTTYPNVSHRVEEGGLGFNFKWNMGWMNDTLKYFELEQDQRKYHHNNLTFAMMYNYTESFILPLSHDEVVHGKKSILDKMSGDYWNKFAGERAYMGYMMGHPGKKLTFMGCEIGQFVEWRDSDEIDFKLVEEYEMHKNMQLYFKELNKFYLDNKALWELDDEPSGFEWIEPDNGEQSVYIFKRSGENPDEDTLVFICNFTSNYYESYRVGVPFSKKCKEILNSDDKKYGGSGQVIEGDIKVDDAPSHNQEYSVNIKLAPMATVVLKGR